MQQVVSEGYYQPGNSSSVVGQPYTLSYPAQHSSTYQPPPPPPLRFSSSSYPYTTSSALPLVASSSHVGTSIPIRYISEAPPIKPTKKEKQTLRHLRKAEEDLDQLRSALQSAQHRLKEREAERKTIRALRSENTKLQERVADLQDSLSSEVEDKQQIKKRLDTLEHHLSHSQARERALENQLREEVRDKEQRHAAVEQLTSEIDILRNRNLEQRLVSSQEEQRRVATLTEENLGLQRRLAEREQQLQDLAQWATAAHRQLQDLSSSVSRESTEAQTLRDKLREMEMQLADELQKKQGLRYHLDLQHAANAQNDSLLGRTFDNNHPRLALSDRPYVPSAPGRPLPTFVLGDEPRYRPGDRFDISPQSSYIPSRLPSEASSPYARTDPRFFYANYSAPIADASSLFPSRQPGASVPIRSAVA